METYLQQFIFILFSVCFIAQLYFLLINQTKLYAFKPVSGLPAASVPVSVIISARNEAKNLSANLPFILQQNYPDFEVIVVNDSSTDLSDVILLEFKEAYANLKIVTVTDADRYHTGKKFALTLGIKAAKNEHLLFTDADCKPVSQNWITRMAANFDGSVNIVLGYSPYKKAKNIVNPFIRFETIKTAISYFSAALRGSAYMGVGRNLAYTKTLFFSKKGFASHMHVLSGDDDIFVNQNATPANTAIETHPETFMYSIAKTSFSAWSRQKKRHYGAGRFYKGKHRFMLVSDALSGLFFYVFFSLSILLNVFPFITSGLFILRLIIQLVIYSRLFKQFDGRRLLYYLPFLDVCYYIFLNIFGLTGTVSKPVEWK